MVKFDNDPVFPDKYCTNCGNELKDIYCEKCGQKKIGLKDKSIKAFTLHFIEELLTFDSKFLRSAKFLLFSPGFLTHEYISGRIVNYVTPVKMYLFVSLITFFVLINSDPDQYKGLMEPRDDENIAQQYVLSVQNSKNMSEDDFKEKFNNKVNDMTSWSLFFIMIAFSVILNIIYFRKNIFYVEHLVFTLHFFSIVLILFTAGAILGEISNSLLYVFLFIIPCFYLLIALKRVYHTRWLAAFISTAVLSLAYWILIIAWITGTIVISALRV